MLLPTKFSFRPSVTSSPSVRKNTEIESKSLKMKEPDHLLNVEYGSKHLGFPSVASPIIVLSFLTTKKFISLFACLSWLCWAPHVWAFSTRSEWGLLLVVASELLTAAASLAVGHSL